MGDTCQIRRMSVIETIADGFEESSGLRRSSARNGKLGIQIHAAVLLAKVSVTGCDTCAVRDPLLCC